MIDSKVGESVFKVWDFQGLEEDVNHSHIIKLFLL